MANTITVNVVADVAKLKSGLNDATSAVTSVDSKMGKFGSTMKKAFTGIGGIVAGIGVGNLIKDTVNAARESEAIGRRTENVIKSMGASSWTSAKQVGEFATQLSNKTAVDDEVIQSGQNLLLTFGNIRNEVGKGNDIFNQTTTLANDMSVAMGQSMKSSAIQLGKALNDPIKGVSALSRVGVSFTEQQKEQIKTLVESGDILGAQKIILGEVQKQFGGAAEAAATPWDKLKVTLGNFQEQVGAKLLPIIDKLAGYLADKLPGWIDQASAAFRKVAPYIKAFGNALKAIGGFIIEHKTAILALVGVMGTLMAVQKAHAAFMAVQAAGGLIKYIAQVNIVQTVTKTWAAVQWLLNTALLANPITLVIVAIVALVAVFVLAWKNSETFRNIVIGAWNAIKAAASAVWGFVKNAVEGFINFIKNVAMVYINTYKTVITTAWNVIKNVTVTVWNAVKNAIKTVWDWLKSAVTTYFNAYKTVITNVWNAVKNVTSTVWNFFKTIITNNVNAVKNTISNVLNGIKSFISGVWTSIKNTATTMWSNIKTAVSNGVENVVNAVKGIKDKILGFFKGAADWLVSFGKDMILGFIGGIKDMAGEALDAVGGVIEGAKNKAKSLLGINSPSKVFAEFGRYTTEGLAKGLADAGALNKVRKASDKMIGSIQTKVGFESDFKANGMPTGTAAVGAAGGTTINVTLEVPVGATGADVGREFVEYIQEYEALNGTRWRN